MNCYYPKSYTLRTRKTNPYSEIQVNSNLIILNAFFNCYRFNMTTPNLHNLITVDMTDEDLMNFNLALDLIFQNITFGPFHHVIPGIYYDPIYKKNKDDTLLLQYLIIL